MERLDSPVQSYLILERKLSASDVNSAAKEAELSLQRTYKRILALSSLPEALRLSIEASILAMLVEINNCRYVFALKTDTIVILDGETCAKTCESLPSCAVEDESETTEDDDYDEEEETSTEGEYPEESPFEF